MCPLSVYFPIFITDRPPHNRARVKRQLTPAHSALAHAHPQPELQLGVAASHSCPCEGELCIFFHWPSPAPQSLQWEGGRVWECHPTEQPCTHTCAQPSCAQPVAGCEAAGVRAPLHCGSLSCPASSPSEGSKVRPKPDPEVDTKVGGNVQKMESFQSSMIPNMTVL